MTRIFYFLWEILTDTVLSLIDGRKNKGFNAQFGSEKLIASRFNRGFLISRHRKLTRRQSFASVALLGMTSSGKTTRILLKILYTLKNASLLVNDPSKELYLYASNYLSRFFEIKVINFSDYTISCGYNILSLCTTTTHINKLADLLTRSSIAKGNADPFWTLQSNMMLQICIRLLFHHPEKYRNMFNVVHIVKTFAASPEKVDRWIVQTKDEQLILDYKAFIKTPEKTLLNVVASVRAALQPFEDENIARVTAHNSINFSELRKKPTIIFLHNSIESQKYVNMLVSIFFEQFYGNILQELPAKKDLDIFVILEELSSLYIDILPVAIVNTRKYRLGNFLCLQNQQFLKTMYGEDAINIISNCGTKIYLPGTSDINTLKEIELLSGKHTYTDNGKEKTKPLVTADEARQLGDNHTLILSSNKPIIKGRTSPFFRSLKYKAYSKLPPPPIVGDIPDEPIPLLQ